MFLVLSRNSAIFLLSDGALSALVTPGGPGSHHVATRTVPLSIFVLHLVLNYRYRLHTSLLLSKISETNGSHNLAFWATFSVCSVLLFALQYCSAVSK